VNGAMALGWALKKGTTRVHDAVANTDIRFLFPCPCQRIYRMAWPSPSSLTAFRWQPSVNGVLLVETNERVRTNSYTRN